MQRLLSFSLVTVLGLFVAPFAHAEQIRVLASTVSRPAIDTLAPMFERSTKHTLELTFDHNPLLKQRIEGGASFDVVIIEPEMLEDLTKQGMIAAGTQANLARVGMALVAAAGTPKRDISTVDGFKATLQMANSIGYVPTGFSGVVFLRTLERLSLDQELKSKLRPTADSCETPVARREVELCAIPATTLAPALQLLGRFPNEVQTYIGISAGIGAKTSVQAAAKSFMTFLGLPDAALVFHSTGFLPLALR